MHIGAVGAYGRPSRQGAHWFPASLLENLAPSITDAPHVATSLAKPCRESRNPTNGQEGPFAGLLEAVGTTEEPGADLARPETLRGSSQTDLSELLQSTKQRKYRVTPFARVVTSRDPQPTTRARRPAKLRKFVSRLRHRIEPKLCK